MGLVDLKTCCLMDPAKILIWNVTGLNSTSRQDSVRSIVTRICRHMENFRHGESLMQAYAILMLAHLCSLCIYEIIRFNKIGDVHIAGMTNAKGWVILWTTGP